MRLSAFVVSAVMFTGVATSSDSELAGLRTPRDQQRSGGLPPAAQFGSIAGRVADVRAQALPGVTVIAIPQTGGAAHHAQTGNDGTYHIGGLADGSFRLDFELPGFDLARRNKVAVIAAASARIDATLHVSTICECITRLPDRPVRNRAGHVFSESGHPLPHARLHVGIPWPEVGYADSEGRFLVRLPVEGRVSLTASSSGFRPVTEPVSGDASAPIVFRLVPDRSADVEDNEQLPKGCRCPGDLFHATRTVNTPERGEHTRDPR